MTKLKRLVDGCWLMVVGAWCLVFGAGASATVETIPGLRYTLQRTDSLRRDEGIAPYQGWDEVGEPVIATGAAVTLTDGEPPKDQAFYRIVVSAP